MFSSKAPASGDKGGEGNQRRGWMSGVLARVRDRTLSPRVVRPSGGSGNKSWSSSTGVITDLTHFERVSLNAAEERVLPPEIRIKIVFAQANAGEQEEEMLEADVKRLDGLVRTIALYSILERNMMDTLKADKLTPDREAYLGKMLVAAVQLELFQMLDDICESGDVENELFDDLCADAIQDGRRSGFITMTAALLLSPGSGYKRLLQIRKDQILEEIADVAGLRKLGGHDCQRDSSESPKTWSPRYRRRKDLDSDCGSPDPGSAGAATGLRISPTSADPRTAAVNLSADLSPSPSSQRPDSRSSSPETGHRRTKTQRVRDLLSSIDGLVSECEQPDKEEEDALVDIAISPRGRSVRGYKRQSTGARLDSYNGGSGAGRVSRLSLHTPPPRDEDMGTEGGQEGEDGRAFFSSERGWRVSPFAGTPPPELAKRRASVIPTPGADEGEDPASADMLLAEVDWLIAGTKAALGLSEKDDDDDGDGDGGDGDDGGGGGGGGGDPLGKDGLEITPDKRELSPRTADNGGDVAESAGATRVAARDGEECEREDAQHEEEVVPVHESKEKVGGDDIGPGCAADAQRADLPSASPERALTASPSPETKVSGASPSATAAVREVLASDSTDVSDGGRNDGDDAAAGVGVEGAAAEGALGGGEEEQDNGHPTGDGVVKLSLEEEESAPVSTAPAPAAVVAGTVSGDVVGLRDLKKGAKRGPEEQGDGSGTAAEEVEGLREEGENGNPTEVAGQGGAAEDEIVKPPVDTTSEPAVPEDGPVVDAASAGEASAPVAEVPLEIGEIEREAQGEKGGEWSGKPAVDAVVESGVVSGVAPEREGNGGGVAPAVPEMNGEKEGAAHPIPDSTEEEANQHEAAGENGSGDHARSSQSPEGTTGASDMEGPPVADVALGVVENDAAREAGSGEPARVVETEVPGLAEEGLFSPEDVAPVTLHGRGRKAPENGLKNDLLGSRKGEEGARTVVADGAEAPALQDVEL